MSELALKLIEKEKRERTGKLDLGKCGLTELPEELFDLEWLEDLRLCNQQYDYKNSKFVYSENKLGNNNFDHLNYNFDALTNLKSIVLTYLNLKDLSFCESLSQIGEIYLSDNQITDISFLEKLTNLNSLDLSSNKITDISFLEKLTNLNSLYLSVNEITDISFLEKLTNLNSLDLSYGHFIFRKTDQSKFVRPQLQ